MAADSSSPSFTPEPYEAATADWLVCTACGTQFPSADRSAVTTCHICDDPRQYVPPSGQSFTTLAAMRGSGTSSDPPYRNVFTPYAPDPRITFITTAPKFAIGQRAALIRTPAGTVLWDCLTLLDAETVRRVRDDFCGDTGGRLAGIVISHPHYYSTHVQWARAFAFRDARLESPFLNALSDVDGHQVNVPGRRQPLGSFTLFGFSAKFDPVATMLVQDHRTVINDFYGVTTSFTKRTLKPGVTVLANEEGAAWVKYLHGDYGKGAWTYLGGHDPEDPQHAIGNAPTDLALHPNSPGYRLILNNVLFPAAKKKPLKT